MSTRPTAGLPRVFLVSWLLAFAATSFAAEGGGAAPVFTFKRGVNISHWLSQNNPQRPYAAPWFTEDDVAWIAAHGFDHIRYPIDGRVWLKADGSLDEAAIVPFERALRWTHERGLGAILDMHFLPGASFDPGKEESAVFTDLELQARVAEFWGKVAQRFAGEGAYLRFELLNEPVAAENEQLNPFNRRMLAAIRASNPTRVVYITSNRWSSVGTVGDVEVPADPNVAITLHFYEPIVFTHQRASWLKFPPDMAAVPFPGRVPDLAGVVAADSYLMKWSQREIGPADIEGEFDNVAAWAAKHAPGREIHLGEFGVFIAADAASKSNYIAAVREAAERRGWGWAVWDYRGSFAVRGPDGNPTPVFEGLFPAQAAGDR